MKSRYCISYSKGKLNIRDRKTCKKLSINIDAENATVFEDAVKSVQYNLKDKKASKVYIKPIDDKLINNQHKQYWGDIPPSNITWVNYTKDEKPKNQTNRNNIEQELNKLLFE